MPFDGAGAQEELSPDLRVGEAVTCESDNLLLLRCELVARLSAALPDRLAGRDQLSARALGERRHSNGGKHVVRRTKLLACVASSPLAPQPLPVEQMRAGELGTEMSPAQPIDRFEVELLGGGAVAQQRPRARLDPQCPVGAAWVIPPGPTAAIQTALTGIPTQPELPRPYWTGLSGRSAVIS
jgi:hypothetical protein